MLDHMEEIFHGSQHGFIKKTLCATLLLAVLNYWIYILGSSYGLGVIYLDFAKAVDSVPHERSFPLPSLITGDSLRPDLTMISPDNTLYML